jgi:hypothetical protein
MVQWTREPREELARRDAFSVHNPLRGHPDPNLLANKIRLLRMWGLESEKIEVIPETFIRNKKEDFRRIEKAMLEL